MDISGIGLTAIFNRCGANGSSGSGNLDEAARRLIEDKDKDGNGTLSALEISISAEAFKLADTNADGELDADELKNAVDIIGFDTADANKDGVLSLEELRAASREIDAEPRAEEDAPKHRSILDFFRSGSHDATETKLNQTA